MLLWALAVLGCKDKTEDTGDSLGGSGTQDCVLSAPTSVDFGALVVADLEGPERRVFEIENTGSGNCTTLSMGLDGSTAFLLTPLSERSVGPGESLSVVLDYSPVTAQQDEATLTLQGAEGQSLRVALEGAGLAPVLELDPGAIAFLDTKPGCRDQASVLLRNTGNLDLILTGVTLEELEAIEVETSALAPLPLTLTPGTELGFTADFAPLDQYTHSTLLTLESNDPLNPVVSLTLSGDADRSDSVVDRFEGRQPQADILFALNSSGGMSVYWERFEAGVSTLLEELNAQGVDFHLAFVMADGGCPLGETPWIDSSMSHAEQLEVFQAQSCDGQLQNECSAALDHREQNLRQLSDALSASNTGEEGCNGGFLRDGATLDLVGFSHESDQSPSSFTTYLRAFTELKGDALEVNAIGGDYGTGCGSAQAYTGLYEATRDSGGTLHSICATDYSDAMTDLVRGSTRSVAVFALSGEPVPGSVTVRVDGTILSSGWRYDPSIQSVVFEPDSLPAAGAAIEVAYGPFGLCD